MAGRFISEDPITLRGGDLNYYRYVRNNPVNRVDPSGKQVIEAVAVVVAGATVWEIILPVVEWACGHTPKMPDLGPPHTEPAMPEGPFDPTQLGPDPFSRPSANPGFIPTGGR